MVVVDEVDVRFRAHEEVAHRIQPKASAEVSQEVCARRVVRTASESTIIEILIETNAFRADATHQFRADMLTSTAPTTKEGIEKYLGSGMVKGIGPIYAKKLVEKFAEKIFEIIVPHRAHEHEAQLVSVALTPQTLEDEKVASAIKTDFILSAEIMAITLAALPNGGLLTQALVLALVGFGITLAVYGTVAVIVKADDAGSLLPRIIVPMPSAV